MFLFIKIGLFLVILLCLPHNILCSCDCHPHPHHKTDNSLTLGFLSTLSRGQLGIRIAGAIPFAIDGINEDAHLLPNHTLKFIPMDAGMPETADSIRQMTNMKEHGIIGFIGPENSCDSEALVASAWNMPMITYKCADRTVSNKSVYTTFARTLPPGSKVSKSLIALLKHFMWNKVVLIVNQNPTDRQVEEAFVELAKEHDIQINQTYYLPSLYLTKDSKILKDIITDSYDKTRIYVLLSDIEAVADFAIIMQNQGLLSSGNYVIISIEDEEVYTPTKTRQYFPHLFDTHLYADFDSNKLFPFRAVLMVTPSAPINPHYDMFKKQVNLRNSQKPFKIPGNPHIETDVPIYAGLAYDAVKIYAIALHRIIQENGDYTNGTLVLEYIKNLQYESILGFSVNIDENGDAEGNFTLLALMDKPNNNGSNRINKSMQPVGRFAHQHNNGLPSLKLEHPIDWIGGRPPASEPDCGFDGEKCIRKPSWGIIISVSVVTSIMLVLFILAFRHYRYEHKLACLLWKVDMKELILLRTNSEYTLQNLRNTINFHGIDAGRFSAFISAHHHGTNRSKSDTNESIDGEFDEIFQNGVGFCKGNVVFIKRIYKRNIDLTRAVRKELIQIREMRHENINPFIGACVDAPNVAILKLYCARGSLEDVLKNQDLDLDNMFIASLVADLIKGMIYLHDSYIISHGDLKSSNCLVDSRWVLQITDFGLHEFQSGQDMPRECLERKQRGLLWKAPELLRQMNPPPRGSQKGDVYSFSVILYEIIGRNGPWGHCDMSTNCILDRVKYPSKYGGQIFRPPLDTLHCPEYVRKCIRDCWHEDPEVRPDFRFINIQLREMQAGLKPNIFDNMIAIMEKYAYNLEGLVQERTNQLLEEKKKTENLLLRMLPKPVAEQLKRGQPVKAESFDSVTIYFSDVVGFTALSAISTPLQVVKLLNNLYTCFDSIIDHYDVYKVETIGDAYMVVSGLPIRNGDRHAGEIASLALHLLSAIQNFEIPHKPGERLKLRIGIHTGPCVAGVVGLKMPRYCLFGDTVNTASRMESSGEALKIHVSEACKIILTKLGGYKLQERGLTPIKGKGEMRTYWLLGKNRPSNSLVPDNIGQFCAPIQQQQDNCTQTTPSSVSVKLCDTSEEDLREFSESCLRDTTNSTVNYRRHPMIKPELYNLKISDKMLNRLRRLQSVDYSGTKTDRFRRIKSLALDDKYTRRAKYSDDCLSYHYNNRDKSKNFQNYHGTSCLNLITDLKEKV
ncbi:guanylate cyclase 32E-like [Brevipalpus obovatus]|uniref:guanylate cyclase 32E-like n=1 Tax=Brevipalpus obovatus TaxID=246614 RepID=UPI003D9ED129